VSTKHFKSPFLKGVRTPAATALNRKFPFNIPCFGKGIDISITKPVTIFVGENGAGKSTLLEAIAAHCGFNPGGGNRNHLYGTNDESSSLLAQSLRLSWFPKISSGFFLRAESFFNFASYVDELAKEDPGIVAAYGGKSLHEQSHGESFLSLFKNRFGRQGIYILDEPEAALSPARQLAFLALLHDLEHTGLTQFIIATHSPILLTYPSASLFSMDGCSIQKINCQDTEHYKLTKSFLDCPERYYRHLFSSDPRSESQENPAVVTTHPVLCAAGMRAKVAGVESPSPPPEAVKSIRVMVATQTRLGLRHCRMSSSSETPLVSADLAVWVAHGA
jgi:predicted ATPase